MQNIKAKPEYIIEPSTSGWYVIRADGARAEFVDYDYAADAVCELTSGDATESDFLWSSTEAAS